GPGRIHHCMRSIGMAERALDLLIDRAQERVTFGQPLADRANIQDWIAEARVEIEATRLTVLKAAWMMDTVGNKDAATEIAAIKVKAPNMALTIIDRAIQVHGGEIGRASCRERVWISGGAEAVEEKEEQGE